MQKCVRRIGSFAFASELPYAIAAKANVPLVRLAKK